MTGDGDEVGGQGRTNTERQPNIGRRVEGLTGMFGNRPNSWTMDGAVGATEGKTRPEKQTDSRDDEPNTRSEDDDDDRTPTEIEERPESDLRAVVVAERR